MSYEEEDTCTRASVQFISPNVSFLSNTPLFVLALSLPSTPPPIHVPLGAITGLQGLVRQRRFASADNIQDLLQVYTYIYTRVHTFVYIYIEYSARSVPL